MSTREAREAFRAARQEEQALHGRAEVHRQAHGSYPDEYLSAQAATAAAFGRMVGPPEPAAEPEAGA